jgi:transposase
MITVDEREAIRRAYYIDKKSMRQIAKELHHSRETVKKAVASARPGKYTLRKQRESPVLGPYQEQIAELLAENEHLPRKQRYTSHQIYLRLRDAGYQGAESTVRGYVSQCRKARRGKRAVYLPLEFAPGADAQVDWGTAVAEIDGECTKVQLFVMRLCYSRRTFVMAFPTQRQECFLSGHVHAFHFFGGVPQRISYDNLKAAVQRILEGRNRQEQTRFTEFRSHYLFASRFCTPGQGHEKGGVEGAVGYVRRNYLVPPPVMDSFATLNTQLLRACERDDQRQVARQTQTIGAAWAVERPHLLPLPAHDFTCCVTRTVVLNGYSQVEFETNRYSVPTDHAYRHLVVQAYPFRVDILHGADVLASHPRCYAQQQDVLDPLHYLPLLSQRPGAFAHAQPVQRWRATWPPAYEQLLVHLQQQWPEGHGVREFIRILQLHRQHPADIITQAVTQALALGCAHYEGVRLCVHHLLHPEVVPPPLDLSPHPELASIAVQPPNVQCYEQLLLGGGE